MDTYKEAFKNLGKSARTKLDDAIKWASKAKSSAAKASRDAAKANKKLIQDQVERAAKKQVQKAGKELTKKQMKQLTKKVTKTLAKKWTIEKNGSTWSSWTCNAHESFKSYSYT